MAWWVRNILIIRAATATILTSEVPSHERAFRWAKADITSKDASSEVKRKHLNMAETLRHNISRFGGKLYRRLA